MIVLREDHGNHYASIVITNSRYVPEYTVVRMDCCGYDADARQLHLSVRWIERPSAAIRRVTDTGEDALPSTTSKRFEFP